MIQDIIALDYVAILQVHQEFLDNIDMNKVLSKFVFALEIRKNLSGAPWIVFFLWYFSKIHITLHIIAIPMKTYYCN